MQFEHCISLSYLLSKNILIYQVKWHQRVRDEIGNTIKDFSKNIK